MQYDYRDYRHDRESLLRAGREAESPRWFAKLLALIFLGLCLALGVLGLLLPILPGLLFLGFAALTAAWLYPPLERVFRRHPSLAAYLDATSGFTGLSWRAQLRVAGWVSLKFMVDSFRVVIEGVARLIRFAGRQTP